MVQPPLVSASFHGPAHLLQGSAGGGRAAVAGDEGVGDLRLGGVDQEVLRGARAKGRLFTRKGWRVRFQRSGLGRVGRAVCRVARKDVLRGPARAVGQPQRCVT